MPRRDTMHPRNDRVRTLLIALFFLIIGTGAQNTSPSTPPPANPPQSQAPAPVTTQPATPQQQPQPQSPEPQGQQQQPAQQQQSQQPKQTPEPAPGQQPGQPAPGTPAGQEPDTTGGGFVFRAQAQEVMLHATVVDEKQRLITNLTRNAFQVFENGQPQPITSFRHEDVPVAMGIVIDNSGSMREKRDKVAKAAENLVASSNPQDQVFVVNFSDEYYLDAAFAKDIRNQYTIVYRPTTPKRVGGYRTIKVDARASGYKGLVVRTRSGYYPGQEQASTGGSN